MESPSDLPNLMREAGKREQTKTRNRRIILDAAKQVFARIGYEAATVRDIIHATDLASGTFYNYFKSKEDIYRAIYDEAARTIRPQLHAARISARTAEEFVTTSAKLYFEYIIREWKEYYTLRRGTGHEHTRFEASEVIAAYAELHGDTSEAIRRGILPPTNVDFLVATLIGITQEVAGTLLRQENGDPDAAAEFVSKFVLGGILNMPGQPS